MSISVVATFSSFDICHMRVKATSLYSKLSSKILFVRATSVSVYSRPSYKKKWLTEKQGARGRNPRLRSFPQSCRLQRPIRPEKIPYEVSQKSSDLATTFSSCLTFDRVAAESRSHRRGRVQGPTSNGLRLLIKLLDRYDRSKPSVPHWYLQLHVTRQGDNKARCAYR